MAKLDTVVRRALATSSLLFQDREAMGEALGVVMVFQLRQAVAPVAADQEPTTLSTATRAMVDLLATHFLSR